MSLQNATPAFLVYARCFGRRPCPQCGDTLLAPESAEFAGEGRVHHIWLCDACGHEFRTAIDFGELDA
jgi:RNase P subunit RPR2